MPYSYLELLVIYTVGAMIAQYICRWIDSKRGKKQK